MVGMLICAVFILSYGRVMALNGPSTKLNGLYLGNTIVVGDTSATWAIADTNYLKGGHMQAESHTDYMSHLDHLQLLTIPQARRSVGMLVTVADDNDGAAGSPVVTYLLITNPATALTTDSDWTVFMPSLENNSGKYLTTDGTNVMWGNGGSSSQWTTTGSDIYYNTGNVGIGTTTPSQKLEVVGNALVNGNLAVGNSAVSGSSTWVDGTIVPTLLSASQTIGADAGVRYAGVNSYLRLDSTATDSKYAVLSVLETPPTNINNITGGIRSGMFILNHNGNGIFSSPIGIQSLVSLKSGGTMTNTKGAELGILNTNIGTISSAIASNNSITNQSTGIINLAMSTSGTIVNSGNGTITNAALMSTYLRNGTNGTATGATINYLYGLSLGKSETWYNYGTVNNSYGIYLDPSIDVGTTRYSIYNASLSNSYFASNIGLGITSPTAYLNIKAGTTTAGTAPLKLTSGVNLGTTEAGAVEYNGTHLYFTAANAGTRYQLDQQVTYPSAGIAFSTGSAWGTSYTTSGTGTVLALTSSPVLITPTLGVATATSINGLELSAENTYFNTKIGINAGLNIIPGSRNNTYVGFESGKSGATGGTFDAEYNTAIGFKSFTSNLTGYENTALGDSTLYSNTTGSGNTASGSQALFNNISGNGNSASGYATLLANTTGSTNTATGSYALSANTTGSDNTANGSNSLLSNTTGLNNSAYGVLSLYSNTTGNNNTSFGYQSGRYIASGTTPNSTSSNSLYLGYDTRAAANGDTNEIVIGYGTVGNGNNTTTLGTNNVLFIGNNTISGKVARFINSAGYCDVNPTTASLICSSDINLKKNITDFNNKEFTLQENFNTSDISILERLNYLTPVNYNWKNEIDGTDKHIGFIAQEMEQIFPNLVFIDFATGSKSIAYTNMIPYMVKAIQEMDLKINEINNLEKTNNWRDNLISWFANSKNGISHLFAKTIITEGMEMKDIATGDTYCVVITNGEFNKVRGKCDEVSLNKAVEPTQPEKTPAVVVPEIIVPVVVVQEVVPIIEAPVIDKKITPEVIVAPVAPVDIKVENKKEIIVPVVVPIVAPVTSVAPTETININTEGKGL